MIKRIIRSITSIQSYSEVVTLSKRSTLAYFLLLSLLMFLAFYLPGVDAANQAVNAYTGYLQELPDFRIEKGQLRIDQPMPMILQQVPGQEIVIIDTSGKITPADLERYETWAVVLKDRMIIKKNVMETRQIDFSVFQEPFTKDDLLYGASLVTKWKPAMIAVLAVMLFILSMIGRYINAIILATLGLIFRKIHKVTLSFDELYKLAVHVTTLPLILTTIFVLVQEPIPYSFLLFYATSSVYLYLAVKAIARQRATAVEDEIIGNEVMIATLE